MIEDRISEGYDDEPAKEFKQGEEKMCYDCQKDRDYCPDCCDGDLYVSPDAYEKYEDR